MAIGGYKILDFENKNIQVGGSGVTIKGIYEALEGNHYKPTMICNLVIDGVERTSRYAVFGVKGQNYVSVIAISGDVGVLTCTITPQDKVTLIEQ